MDTSQPPTLPPGQDQADAVLPRKVPGAILVCVVLILGMSLLAIGMHFFVVGSEKIIQQAFRFLMTVGLCKKLYDGSAWARWVTIGLLGLAVYVAMEAIADIGAMNLLGLMVACYATVMALLLFAPGMKNHFSSQVEEEPHDDWESSD